MKKLLQTKRCTLVKWNTELQPRAHSAARPISVHQVNEACLYVRRALDKIERFLTLCEFSKVPCELEYAAGKMKNTDKHVEALADVSYDSDELH